MRARTIVRAINALGAQQRIILWLDCNHKASVTQRDLVVSMLQPDDYAPGCSWNCTFCPDPPPPEKTPRQLWREAGEP